MDGAREAPGLAARLATGAALLALAWAHRFVQDDAFISFRYAQHLAHGQGLAWNVGEAPVQGFSNLLWTLVLALAMRLGADPVTTTTVLGLAAFAGTLVATDAATRALGGSRWTSWTAMVWVGTSYSASCYATGGLETSVQACLFTWAIVLALRAERLALSIVAGVLLWLRLDSAVVLAVVFAFAAWPVRRDGARLTSLLAPAALMAAALVAFELHTFGSVLPNTFYAKVPGLDARSLQSGAEYVFAFLRQYGLLPFALLVGAILPRVVRDRDTRLLPVACIVAWTAYVVWVGGDFMEFRFVVPVLPLAFALLATVLFGAVASRAVAWSLAAAIVVASFAFEYATYDEAFLQDGAGVETIHGLRAHMEAPDQIWPAMGRELGRAFGRDARVTIAAGACGAVPYYSELRTVDVFGLSDPWVARHGRERERRPGHRRAAPLSYLVEQRVNLLWFPPWDLADPEMPRDAAIVRVPVSPVHTESLLYLVRSPVVDAVIEREGWLVTPARPVR
jgi:arabinofuranosyltransferase